MAMILNDASMINSYHLHGRAHGIEEVDNDESEDGENDEGMGDEIDDNDLHRSAHGIEEVNYNEGEDGEPLLPCETGHVCVLSPDGL